MKKTMIIAALILGISGIATAQSVKRGLIEKNPEKRAEAITARQDKKLSFSNEQQAKVYAMNLKNQKALKAANGKMNREQALKLRKKHHESFLSLLTPGQKKLLKEEGKKDHRRKQKENRRPQKA